MVASTPTCRGCRRCSNRAADAADFSAAAGGGTAFPVPATEPFPPFSFSFTQDTDTSSPLPMDVIQLAKLCK